MGETTWMDRRVFLSKDRLQTSANGVLSVAMAQEKVHECG